MTCDVARCLAAACRVADVDGVAKIELLDKGSDVGICGAANFPTIAQDSAGHFYVVFASQETNGSTAKGPYHVYVVSSKDGNTWSERHPPGL